MRLKTPSAPFSPVYVHGESITIETEGKVLVLPTGNPDILPLWNETVLSSNRLTVEESPFGGLKGSGSPDYAVGTLYTPTDGIYLSDINGTNSTKTLTAGKLAELEDLSVDTTNHTITEEFVIRNDGAGTDVQVIDACDSVDGWSTAYGTNTSISSDGSKLTISGTPDANYRLGVMKTVSKNVLNCDFYIITVTTDFNGFIQFGIEEGSGQRWWIGSGSRFTVSAGVQKTFVLARKSAIGSVGAMPTYSNGVALSGTLTKIYAAGKPPSSGFGTYAVTFDNITACKGTWAQVEVAVPDNLSATSLSLYTHNGTAYQLCSTHSLDGAYSQVSQTSANCTFLDGTKLDDVYGSGLGRAVFPKSSAGTTVNGSTGSITYSENRGTDKRIGLKFNLPPSDNGRTNFNKVRAKLVINYAPDAENVYSATHIFADSTNTSYGLQNLSKPWIALYDPTSNLIDFYLFTYRPKNLEFKRDESGTIYEVTLYPGNGLLYHGQINYFDLTSPSYIQSYFGKNYIADNIFHILYFFPYSGIPKCLDIGTIGSLTKFLQYYGMVI